jgi:tetratricopeptide (TPR) repeat protein
LGLHRLVQALFLLLVEDGGGMKAKQDSSATKQDTKVRKKTSWLVRASAAVLSPLVFLLVIELVLRLFGYGLPSHFFVPWRCNGTKVYLPQPRFCEHFVPPELSRAPESSVLRPKGPSTMRIFVLGSSAANGDPEPAYGFCRQLELLLNEHSQGVPFEVVNAAVTAMNSFVARRIAQDCATHQPDLFIVYMGNNEVVGPYGPPTLPLALYKSHAFIDAKIWIEKDLRLGQLVKNTSQAVRRSGRAPRQWAGMESFLATKVARDDVRLPYCYQHFHKHGLTPTQLAEWDRLFQAGRALEGAGDFQRALAEYEKARVIDNTSADLAFCMGKCLLALNKKEEAKAMLAQARDLDALRFRADSEINRIVRQEAQSLSGAGARLLDLEASLERYNEGFPLGDSLLVDHVHLNVRGNFQIALAAMQSIREAMPEAKLRAPDRSADELYKVCCDRTLYDVREQYRLAMLMYSRKVRPPFAGQFDHETELTSLRAALVQLRSKVKADAEAEAPYTQALKQMPDDACAVRRYADFLLRNRRLADATGICQRFLESHPCATKVRASLAEAYATGGTFDQAVAILTARNTPFPSTRREALESVAGVYVGQGRYAEAFNVYQELRQLDPRDPRVLVNLASAASHTGDAVAAQKSLDEALKIDPNAAPALIDMGNYCVKQGKAEEAQKWFKRAAQADPYNHIPVFSLGLQELRQGRTAEGLKHVTESVCLKPDLAQGYQILVTAYTQLGKADIARQYKALADLFAP